MPEFDHLFALDDLNLGKTSLVKHSIKLTNQIPFKERCQRIPPSQYEEVRKHLKEMFSVGANRKPNRPWASKVALVRGRMEVSFLHRPEEIEFQDDENVY